MTKWPPIALLSNGRRYLSLSHFNKFEFRSPDPMKKRLVLAYSGGLDTSTQLAFLAREKGFEVCAYIADLGQVMSCPMMIRRPSKIRLLCLAHMHSIAKI